MDLKNVKYWLNLSGPGGNIGHVLKRIDSGWHITACRMMTPCGSIIQTYPKRKCRKCIKTLPELKQKSETI